MRLQNKFLALLVPMGLAAAILILFLIQKSVHAVILNQLTRSASAAASSSAQDAALGFQAKSESQLLPLLQSLQKQEGALYAAALDSGGTVLADTTITEKGSVQKDSLTRAALKSDKPTSSVSSFRDEPVMEIAVPVWSSSETGAEDIFLLSGELRAGGRQRLGILKIGLPLKPSLETEQKILRGIFLIVSVIGGVSLGLVLLLVRGILNPISALMSGIGRISQGRYDVDVQVLSTDELGDLASSFNRMSVELAQTTVSKEYVEGILDNMADILIVTGPEGKIETVNQTALEALSYSGQEMVGRPLFFVFQPDHSELPRQECEKGLLADGVRDVEVQLKTKSGRAIPALFSASVLKDRNGLLRGYIGVAKDMTERKRAEEALLAAKTAAEAANKELEAFSYSVAHDLRAPLRAIDGFSQALLENYAVQLDDEGKDFLHRVRAGSQRMGLLINDLLGLSKVTRSVMRREKFDLSAVARDVAGQLKATQPDRNVEFLIEEGIQVQGDPNLLLAAMENLLGNAWKYTKHHASAKIEFATTVHEGKKAYVVRDDGAGFDMAFAKKLFQPFSRLHSAKDFEGTGIGLATVQRIIERHGGRIWGEGQVEKGSAFYFTLGDKS
jgi:PAS domain S-box-containing protein